MFDYKVIHPRVLDPHAAPLIFLHGVRRRRERMIRIVEDFCLEASGQSVFPLFPTDSAPDCDPHAYKRLHSKGVRYDLGLLHIISEVCMGTGLGPQRAVLIGFSGGAQFALRFSLLWPEYVQRAIIIAPGAITHLDNDIPWPQGTGNMERRFNRDADRDLIRNISFEFFFGKHDPYFYKNKKRNVRTGAFRDPVADIKLAADQLSELGAKTSLTVVEDCGHDFMRLWPYVQTSLQV